MNKGRTIILNDNRYMLTANTAKAQKVRNKDGFKVELSVEIIDINNNKKLNAEDIRKGNLNVFLEEYTKNTFNLTSLLNYNFENIDDRLSAITQEKIVIEEDVTRMVNQIKRYKFETKNSIRPYNNEWYSKVNQALLFRKNDLKKLNILETELRSKAKNKRIQETTQKYNDVANMFQKIARNTLDENTYKSILNQAITLHKESEYD